MIRRSSALPPHIAEPPSPIFQFNKAIIDATADLVCAYKPQFAHYAACEAEDQLERTIEYVHRSYPGIPVILDAKRGDVGSTAERYAIEAFERYGADAVTVNPYLGGDSLEPFLRYEDKGVIVLCRTSNPGARDLQDLEVGGRPLFMVVAELAATRWNTRGNCLLVMGATYPRGACARCAPIVGNMPFLVPGVGAQGGDIAQAVENGQNAAGTGLIVSSSRAIVHASSGADFATAARAGDAALRDQINAGARARSAMLPSARAAVALRFGAAPALLLRCGGSRRCEPRSRRGGADSAVPLRGNGPGPDSLDPQKARAERSARSVLRDLYECLTSLDKQRGAAPGVATSWQTSARRADLYLPSAPRGALVQRRSRGGGGLCRRPAAPGRSGHRLRSTRRSSTSSLTPRHHRRQSAGRSSRRHRS